MISAPTNISSRKIHANVHVLQIMSLQNKKIGIVGSGLIGRSWAMLFAGAGYDVAIYDIDRKQIESGLLDIEQQLRSLEKEGMLRGSLTVEEQLSRIKDVDSLEEVVKSAAIIQECVVEDLEIKKRVFKDIDQVCDANTILATSSSGLVASTFSEHLKNRKNVLVCHPLNPPYYITLVEIVPAPWTDPEAVDKTRAIMEEIGQTPVVLLKEITGFVTNKIQTAIIAQAWRLVADGVIDVRNVDKVMSEGLGHRYAFLGPLETCHLNANGFLDFAKKYRHILEKEVNSRPLPLQMNEAQVACVAKQLEELVPLDQLQNRRTWRNACLVKMAVLKKSIKNQFK